MCSREPSDVSAWSAAAQPLLPLWSACALSPWWSVWTCPLCPSESFEILQHYNVPRKQKRRGLFLWFFHRRFKRAQKIPFDNGNNLCFVLQVSVDVYQRSQTYGGDITCESFCFSFIFIVLFVHSLGRRCQWLPVWPLCQNATQTSQLPALSSIPLYPETRTLLLHFGAAVRITRRQDGGIRYVSVSVSVCLGRSAQWLAENMNKLKQKGQMIPLQHWCTVSKIQRLHWTCQTKVMQLRKNAESYFALYMNVRKYLIIKKETHSAAVWFSPLLLFF